MEDKYMKVPRNEYRQPILKCLNCRKESAVLTYEEDRVYKVSCLECGYEYSFKHVSEAAAIEHHDMRLAIDEYRDAEEQGLLVRLPCEVGDVVYWVGVYRGKMRIVEYKVGSVTVLSHSYYISCGRTITFGGASIGKTVYLTREEAEQALAEKGGD